MLSKMTLKNNLLKERYLFFKRWMENPLQLGAITPSSKALAEFVANKALEIDDHDYILELGAGTGTFTQALLKKGFPAHRLLSVEVDPYLYNYLIQRFEDVNFFQGDACNLTSFIPPDLWGKISLVVSGIPMVAVPLASQKKIIDGCFHILKPEGKILQFTYSPFSSIRSNLFNLKKHRVATVFRNIPPATLWCYERL